MQLLIPTGIWRSQEHARAVLAGKAHQEAYKAKDWYTSYIVERLSLTIYDEVRDWRIEEWTKK